MTDAPIHDLTIEILKGIRTDLAGIREEARETNRRLGSLESRVESLETATVAGFQRLEARFDNLLTGEHGQEHARLREHEDRLTNCEESIKELREHLAPGA